MNAPRSFHDAVAKPDVFMAAAPVRMAIPDTVELRGPADADNFRVKVGRYGDRWYHDPLDADGIAATWDGVVPSVSTCKKASGNDWSYVALKRVANALDTDKYRNLAKWPWGDRYEALKAINKLGLNGAAKRGTNVHLMAEAHLYGQPCPITESDPGFEYRDAVDQFFDHYQPTLVAAEFVCIHRTLNGAGYGGTSDAILEIDGKRYLVDWKSRGADSEHGAYPEEGAQIAAYARADYTIAEGTFGPERRRMPHLDGGLVVSIMPDGCRVYPVDLDVAFAHWTALHAWWVARQDERKAIGRQWVARKNASQQPPASAAATPAGVEACIAVRAEPSNPREPSVDRLALVDARGTLCPSPDEGADLTDAEFAPLWDALKALYDGLDPAARSWRAELASQAKRRGVDFLAQGGRTERRYYLNKALIGLALAGDRDDILRELLAHLIGDVAMYPGVEAGHALGSLTAVEAERFAAHVDAYLAPPPAA